MVESANRVCQLFEFEIAQSRLTFLRRWPSENMLGGYETLNNRLMPKIASRISQTR